MAPEVIKREKYNNKVDIWPLGCIIYELFTLNVCFNSKSLLGFVDTIINKKHGQIDLKHYNPKCQELIDLLLSKDYKERPNITEVIKLINNFYSNNFNNPMTKNTKNKNPNLKRIRGNEMISI